MEEMKERDGISDGRSRFGDLSFSPLHLLIVIITSFSSCWQLSPLLFFLVALWLASLNIGD